MSNPNNFTLGYPDIVDDPIVHGLATIRQCSFCLDEVQPPDQFETIILPCLCSAHRHCYNHVFNTTVTLALTKGIITCGSCGVEMIIGSNGVVHLHEPSQQLICGTLL